MTLAVRPTRREDAAQLEQLQRVVFPTLAPDERFEARHYLRHLELFPEGQLVVVDTDGDGDGDGDRVVGMTSTIRLDFDFAHPDHTFADVIQGGWLTSHQPDGRWLYGADIGTHPAYRGRGVARLLYAARHELVRRLGLAGQVTVAMPSGYGAVARELPIEAYVADLARGTRVDPTISAQLRIGFELGPVIADYIHDPVCANYGVVLTLPADRDVPRTSRRKGAP